MEVYYWSVRQDGDSSVPGKIMGKIVLAIIEKYQRDNAVVGHRVLRELTDVIVITVIITFQQSWVSGMVSVDWKLGNVAPILRRAR